MSEPLYEVLNRIRGCKNQGYCPVVVFDLDDTLFSTRERTLRIMREFSKDFSFEFPSFQEHLDRTRPRDIRYGIEPTLANIGANDLKLTKLLRSYWFERFFHDDYLATDLPVDGAVQFVNDCYEQGAIIYYCTGRHHRAHGSDTSGTNNGAPSIGMERGTIQALQDRGFPITSGRAILHLKGEVDPNIWTTGLDRKRCICEWHCRLWVKSVMAQRSY